MYSIIMPTYNCKKYVESSVKSVLSQTYRDFELLIIDDGSTDGSFELLQEISLQDDRIKLHKISHAGVSAARNYGIKRAIGDKILFIDGDDSWEETLLESCVEVDKFNLIVFGIRPFYYDNDGVLVKTNASMALKPEPKELVWEKQIDFVFTQCNISSPCNKVYSRKIIEENNLFFSTNCVFLEDLKFNLDYLSCVKSLYIINKDLYKYRLFITQTQILKRVFNGFFINADEVFVSAKDLLNSLKSEFLEHPILCSILLKAYYTEFCSHVYNKDNKYVKHVLKKLNSNSYYNTLLTYTNGKFFKILRVLKSFRLHSLQAKMIKWRYLNG